MANLSPEQELLQHHNSPKIEGKLKSIFNLPSTLINKLHIKMNELYTNSNLRNPIISSQIHKVISTLFTEEYYPLLSKNIKIDNHNMVVIMGGCAYNMNIPTKMTNILYIPTDDIDMKVYTTDINSLVKQPVKLEHVLSIFKYLIVIICLYLKQIVTEIIDYSRNAFEPMEPYVKHTMKNTLKHTMKNINKHSKKNSSSKSKLKSKSKSQSQFGGDNIKKSHLIKLKQRRFGVLKAYKTKIKIQIKRKNQTDKDNDKDKDKDKAKEIIDITDLSYDDTYKLIMLKLDDPDIMITIKISYGIKYINLIVPYNQNSRVTLTFSDTKIIYPSIENPSFFSYYFMNINKQMYMNKNKNKYIPKIDINTTLETLLKQNINISDIIDTKVCKNKNCHYISIKCLQIDLIYMLRFAELLENEDIINGNIIVPVGNVFKYYKYMIKFIRLHIIKKFFNGTLSNNKTFINTAKKLIRFVENNLNKETKTENEALPINILYKNIISNFHQAFFIKKTMFPEYEDLREIVNDYSNTVHFINRSCAIFKKLDDEKDDSRDTIDSISIQFADKKVKNDILEGKYVEGKFIEENMDMNMDMNMDGGKSIKKHRTKNKNNLILYDNYLFEDSELDNDLDRNIIKNNSKNNAKTHKNIITNDKDKKNTKNINNTNVNVNNNNNKLIIDKLHKMLKNEISFLGKLSNSIRK